MLTFLFRAPSFPWMAEVQLRCFSRGRVLRWRQVPRDLRDWGWGERELGLQRPPGIGWEQKRRDTLAPSTQKPRRFQRLPLSPLGKLRPIIKEKNVSQKRFQVKCKEGQIFLGIPTTKWCLFATRLDHCTIGKLCEEEGKNVNWKPNLQCHAVCWIHAVTWVHTHAIQYRQSLIVYHFYARHCPWGLPFTINFLEGDILVLIRNGEWANISSLLHNVPDFTAPWQNISLQNILASQKKNAVDT